MNVRLTAAVSGHVQGVGFRWWVRSQALELGLVGRATNLDDGRVEVLAEGPEDPCGQLLARLTETPSTTGRPGVVRSVSPRWSPAGGDLSGFGEG